MATRPRDNTCTKIEKKGAHIHEKSAHIHTQISLEFLFRKTRASTLLGFRLVHNLLTVTPAFENILSDGVDIAGIHSKLCAITANLGKRLALSFHHSRGLV